MAYHHGTHAADTISQRSYPNNLYQLRNRQAIAQASGAALKRRGIKPDRLPRESHQQAVNLVQLRRIEVSQDTGERRLIQSFSFQRISDFHGAHVTGQAAGDDGEYE